MMLNILTGRFKLSTHEARMFALASIKSESLDRREEYATIVLKCSTKKIRQHLEELMATHFKSQFIEAFRKQGIEEGIEEGIEQGIEQGIVRGRVEEAANALRTVLAARGIAVLDQASALIGSCVDPDEFKKWTSRAATATTIDQVFAA
ncbi:MAG: hypothetical protein ACRDOI_38525 [Trebonia sp.]